LKIAKDSRSLSSPLAGPAFAAVERLFRAFEEAVNAQALGVVDKLDIAIGRLGLRLCGRPWPVVSATFVPENALAERFT
jgi:hypothetical protein